MASSQGFWSYVHADDQAEGGRISRLARDVADQFEMLTGEALELFLDKDAVKWGEAWRDKVDTSLASVAFVISVLTPRYFQSPECRRELQFFARQSTRLGMRELVLPLLYVDIPSIHDDEPKDDLISLVKTFQWVDWRDLRFADPAAEGYRRGVAQLAARLVEANRQIEKETRTEIAMHTDEALASTSDDSPGFIDQVASAEEAMPRLVMTLESIAGEIEQVGELMQQATTEIKQGDKQAKGFAARRVLVARKVARQLFEPAERVWALGNDYVSQLHDIDQGIRVIIERAPEEVEQNPDSKVTVCTFFDAVRGMSIAAHGGLESAQQMIDAFSPLEKMSRDLRPVLRRLRQGLTTMVEAREVSDEWVQLIDNSGIECGDQTAKAD